MHQALRRNCHLPGLPRLFALTEPDRGLDPLDLARRLGPSEVLIYRHFGDPERLDVAMSLMALSRRFGFRLLIGEDWRLAARVKAHGVHLPQRQVRLLPRLRARFPAWILSTASHSLLASRIAFRLGADCVLRSAILPSRSPSARGCLGPVRLATERRRLPGPVIALGGIGGGAVKRVMATGVHGVAAVEAIAELLVQNRRRPNHRTVQPHPRT